MKLFRRPTEIIAWRGWSFADNAWEPILRSVTYDTIWEGPALTADVKPERHNSHGIYALKARPGWGEPNGDYFFGAAFGRVALSGTVVEADGGYRAERAIIRDLWVGNPEAFGSLGDRFCAWEIAGMLGQRYGVDVEVECCDWVKVMARHMRLPIYLSNNIGGALSVVSAVSPQMPALSQAVSVLSCTSGLYDGLDDSDEEDDE
jgi:hypothetical protein